MEKGAYYIARNEDVKFDIKFSIKTDGDVPAKQFALHKDIEKTLSILRIIFNDNDTEMETYFIQIESLASAGLVQENAYPLLAHESLFLLQTDIINKKTRKIKNDHLVNLGKHALKFSLPTVLLFIVFQFINQYPSCFDLINKIVENSNYCLVWSSCMLGIWLSFGIRKTTLSFEELAIPEKDQLEPQIRLLFTGFIALLFAVLFHTQAITIQIGNISSKDIINSSAVAIIFGTLLGISDQVLGGKLAQKASSILK